MLPYLSNGQKEKLHEVLQHALLNYDVTLSEESEEISGESLVESFLSAKKIDYESKSSEIFMYYFFEYIKDSIQNAASGSIQDNINIDYLTTLNFKIPEKKYQDTIVALLGAIDKKSYSIMI